jgi:hypothetical protein
LGIFFIQMSVTCAFPALTQLRLAGLHALHVRPGRILLNVAHMHVPNAQLVNIQRMVGQGTHTIAFPVLLVLIQQLSA